MKGIVKAQGHIIEVHPVVRFNFFTYRRHTMPITGSSEKITRIREITRTGSCDFFCRNSQNTCSQGRKERGQGGIITRVPNHYGGAE